MDRHVSVAFCDLDGTLVLDNSFHMFMASAWSEARSSLRISYSMQVLPRILGSFSGGHAGLKMRVLAWFARQDPEWQTKVVNRTIARLRRTISVPVLQELRHLQNKGARVVLATAAPEIYALAISQEIGAGDCLATSSLTGPNWYELLGEKKADACRDWLRQHIVPNDPGQIIAITDHADDLPLLLIAHKVVIQASPRGIEDICGKLKLSKPGAYTPEVVTIDVFSPQEGGGYWLWFDDRPEGPVDAWEVRMILSKHRYASLYVGDGIWRPIGPGEPLESTGLRRYCPRPPSSQQRLAIYLRRLLIRNWLGIFH